jgi:hypothetical protein
MNTRSTIDEEIEKTLNAYDNDIPLHGNEFLFTRIEATRNSRAGAYRTGRYVGARVRLAASILLLVVNIVTTVYYYHWTDKKTVHELLVSDLKAELQIDDSQRSY